mgnify:FL=1
MKSVVVEMFNEILYPPQADEEEPDLTYTEEEVDAVEEPPLEVVQTQHPLPFSLKNVFTSSSPPRRKLTLRQITIRPLVWRYVVQ